VQPESLFLRETLSLVVSKQGTLDLSHTHIHTQRKRTVAAEVEMTGVYKVQRVETGDKSICMVIRRLQK